MKKIEVKKNYDGIIKAFCSTNGIPMPTTEYRFHSERRWRFDYAWPYKMVALEIEGGIWVKGRHVRGKGYENDCRKYNEAAVNGWRVLRVTTGMVRNGEMFSTLIRIFFNNERGK